MSVVIGTTIAGTVPDSTGMAWQNHLVWVSNDAAWWLFYCDSTDVNTLKTYRSPDGTTWTAKSSVTLVAPGTSSTIGTSGTSPPSGRGIGVAYKNISSTDVIHTTAQVGATDNADSQYVRATIASAAITWGTATAIDSPGAAQATSYFPAGESVIIPNDNRPIHCSAFFQGGVLSCTQYIRATNADAGSSWTAGYSTAANIDCSASVFPKAVAIADINTGGSNANVLIAYENDATGDVLTNVRWNWWNGTAWSSTGDIFTALGTGVDPNNYGIVARTTTDVHCVLFDGTSTFTHQRNNGGSSPTWSAGATIPSESAKPGSGVAMASDGTNVWMFVIDNAAGNAVKYIKWSSASGNWDGTWSTLDSTSQTRKYISCSPTLDNTGSKNIGVIWSQTNGSNFDVVFAQLATVVSKGVGKPLISVPRLDQQLRLFQ